MQEFCESLPLAADQWSVAGADRSQRSTDWGTADEDGVTPGAVVWPESTEDVAAVLERANEAGVPVTPYGAGTGVAGNAVPARGGVSLDTTRMDEILDARPDDFQVDVQPGVVGTDVDEAVERYGQFFPPLPTSGAMASVGGMVSTDASGRRTVKYGTVGDWVREIEAVAGDGTVFTAGTRAVKSSSGYNLRDLVVGSEGTLAVVTRVTLETAGIPEQIRGGRAVFESVADAAAAVADARRSGVDVASMELVDEHCARITNDFLGTDLPDRPMVFLEFHRNHGVDAEIEFCEGVFADHDPISFETVGEAEMSELWELREELPEATVQHDPDLVSAHSGDVAVPPSEFTELVAYIHERAAEADLLAPSFGHVGDGNVHFDVLVDPADAEMVGRGEAVAEDIVGRAIELGGTCTAEHGIGNTKRKFVRSEHGDGAVDLMGRVKECFDPNGVLNPGKVLPED
ncbi:FAD-binding oxidoreductase [Halobacterium sp. R2-5]|uniref:FAD-binding oxidoreductase n=1 Tax=Halobacterium sp. R2-5 TaxID=2715751 RepID=UPI001422CB28|nr:FAD-binding oxidoreductase [Halobacterium sp. R2-5]NIB99106.1 FAD-binding oxidoreductase [Halobacterium sp. R2-5]